MWVRVPPPAPASVPFSGIAIHPPGGFHNDKTRQPVLGNVNPNAPDETAPWTICISGGETQYLFASDVEPGRIYKRTLEGRILGRLGEPGRQLGQFNWLHGISCRSEDTLYVADPNNRRVQKLLLDPRGSSAER